MQSSPCFPGELVEETGLFIEAFSRFGLDQAAKPAAICEISGHLPQLTLWGRALGLRLSGVGWSGAFFHEDLVAFCFCFW